MLSEVEVKEISLSSKILKLQNEEAGLNTFGFENFDFESGEGCGYGQAVKRIPLEVRKELDRRLKEIEEKEAIAEKRGYERGFAQGEKDGREIGKQSMEIIARQLSELVENLRGVPDEIASRYSDTIKGIILDISRKVLQVEIDENSEVIRKSLELAFAALSDAHRVTIRLNPRDHTLLKENLTESLGEGIPEETKISWKPDPEIAQGGCILETDTQFIDATIESRMKQVEELLGKTSP